MIMEKLIITVALTGNVPTKKMNPNVPMTPDEIATDVRECAEAGASLFHIHARDDLSGKQKYKEDFFTASNAAINGGVTHLCDMPNNPQAPIDKDSYIKKLNLTKKALVPVLLYAGIDCYR